MTDSLTARQTSLLKTIIDEYITTAEAVGSEILIKNITLVFPLPPLGMKW